MLDRTPKEQAQVFFDAMKQVLPLGGALEMFFRINKGRDVRVPRCNPQGRVSVHVILASVIERVDQESYRCPEDFAAVYGLQ